MTGGFAGSCDPRRVSLPDSEGMVFEAACGSFENAEEFHVLYREG